MERELNYGIVSPLVILRDALMASVAQVKMLEITVSAKTEVRSPTTMHPQLHPSTPDRLALPAV